MRALLDGVPVAVFVHDGKGRFLDANQAACVAVGYSHEQLMTMSVFDIEQEHNPFIDARWSLMHEGKTFTFRGRHKRADDSTVAVEVAVRPFTIDGQRLFSTAVRPIEEPGDNGARQRAQLFESNVFRHIFENSTEAIAVIDHDGRYLLQNKAHKKLLGYSDAELADKTPAIHLGPAAFHDIAMALSHCGEYRGEHLSRANDGTERRIELSAFAIERGDGLRPAYVGIKRDVTAIDRSQREQADRERIELEESLRQAHKMEVIGQLAAGVAHDINNLLTPILAHSDSEATNPRLPSSTRQAMAEIREAAKRGRNLTRHLLAFGRRQTLEMKAIDLASSVKAMLEMLRRIVPEEIEFDIDLTTDLPRVMADATAIEQVLMNLATNAADAMNGSGVLRIAVENLLVREGDKLARALGSKGNFVQLTVSDTGSGMDTSTLERVFEPFFTLKPPGHGTGLGLSIVHGIIRQHGGFITVESEPGHGTTFRIFLSPTTQQPEPRTPTNGTAPVSNSTATILVVEDDAQVRHLVCDMLEGLGHNVLVASNGTQAIAAATSNNGNIDLLLTDIVMPGVNGLDLYTHLRRIQPELPALFMSGYPRDGLDRAGKLVSEMSIIEKPFTRAELAARVQAELASPRPRR
ncbi:MAG: PAS domain S-box protein [Planctomycetes bacterium]|nr:PAS domain S-box protein [Planctomycetota bacterium]